jgi:penicillin-binding protein 1A
MLLIDILMPLANDAGRCWRQWCETVLSNRMRDRQRRQRRYQLRHFQVTVTKLPLTILMRSIAFWIVRRQTLRPLTRQVLRVQTTIDPDLQAAAEQALLQQLDALSKRFRRDATLPQGALVALDPRTGYVLAMVGGRKLCRVATKQSY